MNYDQINQDSRKLIRCLFFHHTIINEHRNTYKYYLLLFNNVKIICRELRNDFIVVGDVDVK